MLHLKLRQISFPFKELVELIPDRGKLLDVGCGFGYLLKLLAEKDDKRKLLGFDISANKISLGTKLVKPYANIWLYPAGRNLPRVKVRVITLIDVLYLLDLTQKTKLLRQLYNRLDRGGKLLVATVPKDQSWRYYLAWLQEWVMVKGLARTKSAVGVIEFETRHWLKQQLRQIGFRQVKEYQLPDTLLPWQKHVVFIATKV
ncbi:MAG: hypothetical protein A2784_03535 [Candidatus Chisholmbacteria bacterium RIFCSPHIGHO2_01_FULL_48_12]|uniref:Methyltransferase domain-containing protein n=1 Tax=Candidatus Chisholmbacteria bacterium RIFCSPHIGHO2_01_FULL_48_12 TaxID=1797589 RepID=A0A1G1VUA1_9BACT|nr:MAG: hypothetical protein A2784_03535 [Candidatus Chisholmbacteria bacterium RIFCSPHIGHO2_01_FULL_48_12]